ncbi:PilW family protein [Verminephrobacter eiseniae]|uniref:PilW family protein n=1 Tax=Verminephrobacter eiseniae TaxID=364317 RepID=UPI002238715F|nr:PilW family protein [Verminephrobacter eiseniae]MCW5231029.1 pilus assembly protein PilW [Verminephrobacter eiseniae]MCW5292762.1 pilus assembly protein PilW [Verminephrobacter eiseniae]MCW8184655.1 pilus assembly protein PilW [Verminephrobacter eiseniae]MCW8223331.1 pilus assembly protein PilW [Verminephrobacter eiseniae]MCW8234542.1 pilus assembly protein PilW [Verminephrobacter eiseniae]
MTKLIRAQQGLSIIELLVAMTVSMVVVIAAAYTYLSVRESQRAIDRTSSSRETGAFVMQMLGREIMMAGFYPATAATPMDLTAGEISQKGMYDTYPPLPSDPSVPPAFSANDWPKGPAAFQSGIFGCDGGEFNVATSTCPTADANAADTVVINYFTSDSRLMGGDASRRLDCTGRDVASPEDDPEFPDGGDSRNAIRKKNADAAGNLRRSGSGIALPVKTNKAGPPQLPVFVSNRFTLKTTRVAFDQFQKDIMTKSLVCSGNGSAPPGSPPGDVGRETYSPIVAGLEDLQFAYGIHDGTGMKFFTATEIGSDAPQRWQNVIAVRVCLLTRTLGGNTRLPGAAGTASAAGAASTYRDCHNGKRIQPAGDTITRYVEEFGLRNNMKQHY